MSGAGEKEETAGSSPHQLGDHLRLRQHRQAFGGSPVMAHAREEVADMAEIADALVLNIGTLTSRLVEAMIIAGKSANKKGIPVVLDVCEAGATPLRDRKCFKILDSISVGINLGQLLGDRSDSRGERVHQRSGCLGGG